MEKGKTMILIMPVHMKIYEAFLKNLDKLNIDVKLFYASDEDFKYNSFGQKLMNFVKKNLLRDKSYKENLKANFDDYNLKAKLKDFNDIVDFALVIRPDYFNSESLKLLKTKTKKMIGYQWDGVSRYPRVKNLISVFDRFFLFDAKDYEELKNVYTNVRSTTNFYFDYDSDIQIEPKQKSVFFIGSFIENRINDIVYMAETFKKLGYKTDINLLYFDDETPLKYKNSGINFINRPLTYLEAIERVKSTTVLLDFMDSVHSGLSFRIFESLKYSKKLVTTNLIIKDYDFYNENDFCVWQKNTSSNKEFLEFLDSNYSVLDAEIIQKYSFSNWVNRLLNS
jgi:hypothetical protein